MVKDNETVIKYFESIHYLRRTADDDREFNELVNMTAEELEDWLQQEQSEDSGWDKGDGESVGHER